MAIDREETLRKAEKLLRQGRLDAAIEEYARVAQETPDDLATINKLGELYQRAGQVHTAITYFRRVADQWLRDGLDAKAAGHYKKILKLRPDDEAAMLQLVDALTAQGQLEEAKTHLRGALDRRQAAGDRAGAEDLILRLGDLDPNDFDARLMGLRIKLGRNQTPELAAELRQTITELDQRGRPDEADALLRELIRLDPADIQARVRVARTAMGRGDIETVRSVLPPKPAESKHYDIVWMAAELDVIAGELEGGRSLLMRSLTIDRVRGTTDVLALAERLRKKNPAATWTCMEALVEDRASAKDFAKAADHLKRFLKQTPGHVPALLRLVEVCVDGDLEPDLTLAQALLADAYLQVGEAAQARVISEDLLSREPRSAAHRERLKRALIALGEEDPEAVIADHLNFLEIYDEEPAKPEPPQVVAKSPEPDLEPELIAPSAPPAAPAKPASREPIAAAPPPSKPAAPPPAVQAQPPAPPPKPAPKPAAPAAPAAKPPVVASPAPAGPAANAAPPAAPVAPSAAVPQAPKAPAPAPAPAAPPVAASPKPSAPPKPKPAAPAPPPAEPAFEAPDLGLGDEPDFGAVAASPSVPAHHDAPDMPEPAWPGEGSGVMFEPDLGGPLGSPDSLLASPDAASPLGAHAEDAGANGHHDELPGISWDAPADDDLEVDLTGALDAIGTTPTVSVNDALGKAVSRPVRPEGAQNAAGPAAGGQPSAMTGAGTALATESVVLVMGEIEISPDASSPEAGADAAGARDDAELDAAFDLLREQAAGELAKLPQHDKAARLMRMGETYLSAGMMDEARSALEQASADPRFRFRAMAALGRLYRRHNQPVEALRWLEQAAEAAAPNADDGRALLYDLADTLERTGEGTRALATWLDLLAEQDDYRDVRTRIDRLVRTQS